MISCDTITDFPLKKLIDSYRIHSPTLLALISPVFANNETTIPGRKGREKPGNYHSSILNLLMINISTLLSSSPEKDLIGIDTQNGNRLVFLSSEVDFDETVPFSVSMLKK